MEAERGHVSLPVMKQGFHQSLSRSINRSLNCYIHLSKNLSPEIILPSSHFLNLFLYLTIIL